ncbi:DPY30 domain containing 2 isoform X2 [Silurus meridionalis]|uniref:DPY30 domain containing 2 isoform X2 n=1 Tax=Silurus meridionalis TaxID=175797 RepID=UPI001EEA52EA|nr:DPY30 domain containing 2 isoform X2 [Silurus meridionalis]
MDSEYLKQTVGRCLVEALVEVVELRPPDPIEFLAHYIYRYQENMEDAKKKAEYKRQVAEEVQKCKAEAEHQKRLKEEEERIRAAQQDVKTAGTKDADRAPSRDGNEETTDEPANESTDLGGSKPPDADGMISEDTGDATKHPEEPASVIEPSLEEAEVRRQVTPTVKDSDRSKPPDVNGMISEDTDDAAKLPEEPESEVEPSPSQAKEEDSSGSNPPNGLVPVAEDYQEGNPEETESERQVSQNEGEKEEGSNNAPQTLIGSAEEEPFDPEPSQMLQEDAELTHTDKAEDQSGAQTENDSAGQEEPETLIDPSMLNDTEGSNNAPQTLIGSAEEELFDPEPSQMLQEDAELTHTDKAEDQSGAQTENDSAGQEEPETLTDPSMLNDTEKNEED